METNSENGTRERGAAVTRRAFVRFGSVAAIAGLACATGCSSAQPDADINDKDDGFAQAQDGNAALGLPPASPNMASDFGVDENINMKTIDQWLNRDDVAYRDMRMLVDPAHYEDVGGYRELTFCLNGFKVVPFPYIGTLQVLPVEGTYDGQHLFDIKWDESGEIVSVEACYKQSEQILDDLFPKDKAVFLMCGGGGYADMMRKLLVSLGWDDNRVYNVGGAWEYPGKNLTKLAMPARAGRPAECCFWRADVATIDFDTLSALES